MQKYSPDQGNKLNNNLLLTERESRSGEYWPEIVAVRTKTTKGQYSQVRLEQARLVRSLLNGTRFLIVLVANFEFVGFAPKQKYANWTVSMEMVRTAKS